MGTLHFTVVEAVQLHLTWVDKAMPTFRMKLGASTTEGTLVTYNLSFHVWKKRHWEVKAPVCGQRWKWWIRSWAQAIQLQRALKYHTAIVQGFRSACPLKVEGPKWRWGCASALLCQPQFSGPLRGFQKAFWPGAISATYADTVSV